MTLKALFGVHYGVFVSEMRKTPSDLACAIHHFLVNSSSVILSTGPEEAGCS